MKNSLKIASSLILCVLILAGLSGCGQKLKPLTAEEIAQVETLTDTVLEGIEKRDYAIFSADFDPNMLEAMKEPDFIAMTELFDETIGAYQSRSLTESRRILNAGSELILCTYRAKYAKDPGEVTITLYFTGKNETLLVAGLSYDSQSLREKESAGK